MTGPAGALLTGMGAVIVLGVVGAAAWAVTEYWRNR